MTERSRYQTVFDFDDEINAIADYVAVINKFSERAGGVSPDETGIVCRMAGLIMDNLKPMMEALESE